jgi:hypothetical protein
MSLSSPVASATALVLALFAPTAFGQTEKEKELEERIAQLEKLVEQMAAQQSAPAAPAAAPASSADQPIQATTITPTSSPTTKFRYGGFIKVDALYTDTTDGEIPDGTAGRLFYLPSTIPVGAPAADESTDLDFHAQFSRFWFGTDTTLSSGSKLASYLEFDLWGGGSNAFLGNETATNTHGLAVRHMWVSWDKWLAGQTWSNFQDVLALPDSVDFVGPTEGTIFVRQAQLRYTTGAWTFSLENPETTVTPFGGTAARISSDDNNLPDVIARWMTKGAWGHFTVAGMLRQFKYQNPATGINDSASGGAISVSGKWNLSANDDIRFMLNAGPGIGRYLGLAIASDTVLTANGGLDAIDGLGAYVGYRHVFNQYLRGNVFYSLAKFDNDIALTGGGVTESVESAHVNLIYSPLPKLDLGAELILAERSIESGADGELRRLHMHVKYNF